VKVSLMIGTANLTSREVVMVGNRTFLTILLRAMARVAKRTKATTTVKVKVALVPAKEVPNGTVVLIARRKMAARIRRTLKAKGATATRPTTVGTGRGLRLAAAALTECLADTSKGATSRGRIASTR
jgi:hypothetical protein